MIRFMLTQEEEDGILAILRTAMGKACFVKPERDDVGQICHTMLIKSRLRVMFREESLKLYAKVHQVPVTSLTGKL